MKLVYWGAITMVCGVLLGVYLSYIDHPPEKNTPQEQTREEMKALQLSFLNGIPYTSEIDYEKLPGTILIYTGAHDFDNTCESNPAPCPCISTPYCKFDFKTAKLAEMSEAHIDRYQKGLDWETNPVNWTYKHKVFPSPDGQATLAPFNPEPNLGIPRSFTYRNRKTGTQKNLEFPIGLYPTIWSSDGKNMVFVFELDQCSEHSKPGQCCEEYILYNLETDEISRLDSGALKMYCTMAILWVPEKI